MFELTVRGVGKGEQIPRRALARFAVRRGKSSGFKLRKCFEMPSREKIELFGLVACVMIMLNTAAQGRDTAVHFAASSGLSSATNSDDVGFAGFGPYRGIVVKGVDTTTLSGKVMCGYQGWFGTPGDGSSRTNWQHWTKR